MESVVVGSRINRYEIVECIHKTELIGLYKAYDTKLERLVYLKLVLHGADYSDESIAYFLNEAKALAKLSHPNIIKVLDFGYNDECLYIINEYTEGQTLFELIGTPIDWQRAIKILLPITDALSYAHSKGVIHRDLRPENIILTKDDQPLLSDFSLMRIIEDEETRDMTGTKVGLGSPAYISPEQGKGLSVDFRSDIYSLGVVFFEMVTGQKPFDSDRSMEIVIQHVMKEPPKPSSLIADLPSEVENIILTSLAKDANKRYQTMEQLATALRSVLPNDTKMGSRPGKIPVRNVVLFSLIGLGLLVGGYWIWKGRNSIPDTLRATETISVLPTTTSFSTEPPSHAATPEVTPIEQSASSTTIPEATLLPPRAYNLPEIPVLPGAKVPVSNKIITSDNVGDIVELARLGVPQINRLLFIENDQILLGATSAGVYFFNANNLEPVYLLDTKGWLTCFALSSDQKWIATGDIKGNVAIWDINTGENVAWFAGGAGEITSVDFSSDNTKIAFSAQNIIQIWDLNQNALLFTISKDTFRINKLVFLPGSDLFITGGDNRKVGVWDSQTGKLIREMSASYKVIDLSISNTGQYVAAALYKSTIEVWDINEGKLLHSLQNPNIVIPFTCISGFPNSLLVLAGSMDGVSRIWNILRTEMLWDTPLNTGNGSLTSNSPVRTLAISRDGTKAAILSENGIINLWDLTQHHLLISQDLSTGAIERVAVSLDGQVIAYQVGNSFVDIYSTQMENRITRLSGTLPRGNPISADGTKILIRDNDLKLYSLSPTEVHNLYTFYGSPASGLVNFILDDKIAAVSLDNFIQIWSTNTGRELDLNLPTIKGNCTTINRLDGSFLAAGSANGILGKESYINFFCEVIRKSQVISGEFQPDGSIVVFAMKNQTLEVWNALSDKGQTIKSKSPGDMLDVAISNDGKLLAAASASGVIEIYDLTTFDLLHTLDPHASEVNQITFSNDQKYLISGSDDGTVRIWGVYP